VLVLAVDALSGLHAEQIPTSSKPRARRGRPAFKPGPPSMPEIPEGPPFVGEDGLDAFEYPLRRPDATVLLALLEAQRFEELDAAMNHYEDAFEADYRKERWPRLAMDAFMVPSLAMEAKLDAWVEASPDSFGAWAARAAWRYEMGWELRGHAYSNKTLDSQFAAMGVQHEHAVRDYAQALSLRPRAVGALQGLILLARSAGDDAGEQAYYARAIELCPKCFGVRQTYVLAIAPKWGGSWQHMDEAAAAAPVKRNRKLALLAGLSAFDRCRTLSGEKRFDEALEECAVAERKGVHPLYACETADILNRQKRYAEALAKVEPALRIDPQNEPCLREREFARRFLKDYVGAAQDILTLRRLGPYDEGLEEYVDWAMQRLRWDANQAAKAGRTEEEAELRALANLIVPGGGDVQHPGGVPEDALDGLRAAIAAAPDDFDAHLKLDQALAPRRRFPEIVAMWNVFLDAHPDHARAWMERGGAKWHAGDRDGAIADTERACELGLQSACGIVPQMRARAGR
jgi:tetratricopeptide (TPR) repeat protein